MRKITSLLMLLCMFVGTAWGQGRADGFVTGFKGDVPTEKVVITKGLETGYYLLKQVNDHSNCAGGNGVGWIKAASEAAGASATSKGTGTPGEDGALYIWYVEVVNAAERTIKISTANKIASWYLPENSQREKGLTSYASATTLQYHYENHTHIGGCSETHEIKEGAALISNFPVTSYIHFSGDNLGTWTSCGTNSTFMVEFYQIPEANLIYKVSKDALKAKIEELSLSVGRLSLQTADSEGAFYLSAVTDADGNTVNKLIDGNPSTFYGSSWGAALGHLHYWQIDLVDATLPEFTFGYITRANGSDTPTKIDIKGSTDGKEFINIESLTDLPTAGGSSYKSTTISNSEGYRYIRFEVPSTNNNYHPAKEESEVTIALAEFAMFRTEANYTDVDKYILSKIAEAQVFVDKEDATQAEVDAALAALTGAVESTIKYSFQYGGVEKYTQEVKNVGIGQKYPEYTIVFPYGISAEAQTGSVQIDECGKVITKIVELKKTADTPFESYASVNDVQKWYYVQVHANKDYQYYVKHANDMLKWNGQKSAPASELDEHLWAFVGDVFGMKFVNKKSGQVLTFAENGTVSMSDEGTKLVITSSDSKSPWFCFKYPTNGNYVNANVNRQDGALSSWTDNDAGSSFKVTLCEEMEVVVKEAGYATLFKNSPVIIPETVEAYVVAEVASNSVKLQLVEGTLPANTGVILKGAGTHKFITSADVAATIESNLLSGTVETKEVEGPAYVLASINNVTGFYAAKLTDGKFVNNAGKAYLPKPVEASARFISFDFGTETAIDELKGENGNVKTAIYDLSGRRVQKAQKGLYIVNGVKVIK